MGPVVYCPLDEIETVSDYPTGLGKAPGGWRLERACVKIELSDERMAELVWWCVARCRLRRIQGGIADEEDRSCFGSGRDRLQLSIPFRPALQPAILPAPGAAWRSGPVRRE